LDTKAKCPATTQATGDASITNKVFYRGILTTALPKSGGVLIDWNMDFLLDSLY